jgi:hypothetical protein
LRFNADTGSNYGTAIYGAADGSFGVAFRTTPTTAIRLGKTGIGSGYLAGYGQFEIPEYASTSYSKQISGQSFAANNSYSWRLTQFGTWDSTSAITSITILTTDTAGTFSAGTALLYGVS